jgi:hypothetical protein
MNMVLFGLRSRQRHSNGVNKIFQSSVIVSVETKLHRVLSIRK